MNRNIIAGLAAGLIAATALAAPASAGYKRHHHHGHHFSKHYVKHHVKKVHRFHAYRKVYYKPVCVKFSWVYSYGHKKWACVLWK